MVRLIALVAGVLVVEVMSAQTVGMTSVGPVIGSTAPPFSAVDQFGRTQTLDSLVDREGLMLVFFRSADW